MIIVYAKTNSSIDSLHIKVEQLAILSLSVIFYYGRYCRKDIGK